MRAVYPTAYVPLSPAEIERYLLDLVDVVADAVRAEPFTAEPVAVVGRRLVEARFTGPDTLRRTVEVLGRALLVDPGPAGAPGLTDEPGLAEVPDLADVPDLAERAVAVLGAISSSFATAMRLDAFDQQEEVKQALLAAKRRAERGLRVSEARFREVFDSAGFGVVIADPGGTCVEVNEALAEMVDRDRAWFAGRRLAELFDPDDAEPLAAAYRAVGEGRVERFRERRRLLRADGEPVWAHLAVSLLRDDDGAPAYHVTMVEDVSELHLLRKNLDFQLLHDSLTGLANRQLFISRLEALHSRGEVTLYHLDLDGFSVVNNGLGHEVGDRLLKEVARRLEVAVADEEALVARMGGDEFAVAVVDSPAVPALVERINEALERPMAGGVALSCGIGVVDRPAAGWDVGELLRAANATLRRAKAAGRRQWLPYDPREDQPSRVRSARAARMPGALADGELEVEYQPVVEVATGRRLGHVARLRWDELGHDECLELAESNGLSPVLGQWALREAAGEVAGVLFFELSATQSRDEDLVRAVKRTLDETGLPASRLRLFLDTRSVFTETGQDNARVLRDSGITTGLSRFNGGQAELSLLAEVPVDALVLDPSVVCRLADGPEGFLHDAITGMVGLVRRFGTAVLVPDVRDPERAAWWARVGVDAAFGDHFGPAVPGYEL